MSVELLGCTLRDGTYVNDAFFGFDTVKNIIKDLSESKIDVIECGWLKNVLFEKDKTIFSKISDIEPFLPEMKTSQYSLMLYHNEYDLDNLPLNCGMIDIIREIFHKDSYKDAIKRSEIIKDSGYKLFYQAVNTIEYNNRDLMELSGLANRIMPDCIYIVDTHGSMFREDLKRIFEIMNENLKDEIKIGFHSHNNLQLSFSLTIDFIEMAKKAKRDIMIDSSLFGMGRGAGNLNTELIAEYLNRFYFKKYNTDIINNLIVNDILKFKKEYDWGYNVNYLLTGSYNIHSRYAKYLTDKYNVNPETLREILNLINKTNEDSFSKAAADKAFDTVLQHN